MASRGADATEHKPELAPPPVRREPRTTGFNRFMVRWLRSPLGVLSGGVVLVRYTGRVTGSVRELPVNCSRYENGLLIRVGRPEQKTWWRNFREPWPIELVRGGNVVRGVGTVVLGSSGRGQRLAADYFMKHHGAARRAGLPRLDKGELPSAEALAAAAREMVFVVVMPES
jgi:hypothetical protein